PAVTIDESGAIPFTAFIQAPAGASGVRVRFAFANADSVVFRVIAGDEIPVVNGEFELTIPEGQRQIAFLLVQGGDVDADAALTLSATLLGSDGQPTHQTHVELNITLDAVDEPDQAATTNDIPGDFAIKDFDPGTPGIQSQKDVLGNFI